MCSCVCVCSCEHVCSCVCYVCVLMCAYLCIHVHTHIPECTHAFSVHVCCMFTCVLYVHMCALCMCAVCSHVVCGRYAHCDCSVKQFDRQEGQLYCPCHVGNGGLKRNTLVHLADIGPQGIHAGRRGRKSVPAQLGNPGRDATRS